MKKLSLDRNIRNVYLKLSRNPFHTNSPSKVKNQEFNYVHIRKGKMIIHVNLNYEASK